MSHNVCMAFELIRAGSRLEATPDESRGKLLGLLERALLPGHYEALLGEAPST